MSPCNESVQEIPLVASWTDVQLTLRWKLRSLPRSHRWPVMEQRFERRLPHPKVQKLSL